MNHVKLENIGNRRFLVYTLKPEEVLDPVILGMMENNMIGGLVPVSFLQKDEQQILKYDISGMKVLEEFLHSDMDGLKFVLILKSMAEAVLHANEYMIAEGAILFGMHSVFADKDGKGHLVCLPVENRRGMTFQQFCTNVLQQPAVSGKLGYGPLSYIKSYLDRKKFSIKEFSLMLDRLELQSAIAVPAQSGEVTGQPVVLGKKERVSKPVILSERKGAKQNSGPAVLSERKGAKQNSGPAVLSERKEAKQNSGPVVLSERKGAKQNSGPVVLSERKRPERETPQMGVKSPEAGQEKAYQPVCKSVVRGYLYQKSSQEKIAVDKSEFRIGKSSEGVDCRISQNPSVSRRHAVIIRRGDIFSVADTGSLNHTFVDGNMILEGQEAPLENGTQIRLADEEFIFLIEKE